MIPRREVSQPAHAPPVLTLRHAAELKCWRIRVLSHQGEGPKATRGCRVARGWESPGGHPAVLWRAENLLPSVPAAPAGLALRCAAQESFARGTMLPGLLACRWCQVRLSPSFRGQQHCRL